MTDRPIKQVIQKAEDLLQMPTEQLATILLKLAYAQRQAAGFIPHSVSDFTVNDGYPVWKKVEVETRLTRTWNWIERNRLIESSGDRSGSTACAAERNRKPA